MLNGETSSMRKRYYLTNPKSKKLEDMGPDVVKPSISSSFNDTEQQETLILVIQWL